MSDYIVLVVVSIGISVCLSGAIIGVIKGDSDATIEYLMTNIKSLWERIRALGDEIDILRARIIDLENRMTVLETKVNEITKETEKLDDGK